MTANPLAPEDDPSFSALDRYLDGLHAGARTDRARFLADHPELAEALKCLEALDRLAAPAERPVADGELTLPPLAEFTDEGGAPAAFGNYQDLQELGRGGMGVVFKALHRELGRTVAVKMILAGQIASADHRDRFHDEMRALAALEHPNIVRVYDAGEVHGQPYFAMQHIAGPSLADEVRSGPLAPQRAARILAAVTRGVAHLHARGFVHRDLKPSNILLDEHDTPYVTDFGLVKVLQSDSGKTASHAIMGTAGYMAPEQAAGHAAQVGAAADVYGLGAILFELLTGRPPFKAEALLDTLVQVIESEPTPPTALNPSVPRALEIICLKCLEKAPEDRYVSADALAADLQRYLDGEVTEAQEANLAVRLRRWSRREPALASRLLVLAACVVIIQVNYYVGGLVDPWLHWRVLIGFALWGAASVAFQWLLRKRTEPGWIPFAWSAADAVLLTGLLSLDHGLNTPFTVSYACLIAAAGLWFRVGLVWFATGVSLLGYVVLLTYHICCGETVRAPHQHVIYAVALIMLGFVIAYQVRRVRALSRYYESRPLPR